MFRVCLLMAPVTSSPGAEGREDLGHSAAVLGVERTESGWGGWQGRIGRALCQLRELRLILSLENV